MKWETHRPPFKFFALLFNQCYVCNKIFWLECGWRSPNISIVACNACFVEQKLNGEESLLG